MKISINKHIYRQSNIGKRLFEDWCRAASEIELEYGVWVEVKTEEDSNTVWTRIYFEALNHQFDSLRDLRKALDNKAFM